MERAPTTSITLLKAIAADTGNIRWTEFFHTYEELMRNFLRTRFPSVDADDILQETMLALTKCLPNYHCTPDEHRHFHNYLIGILKHKAEDAMHRQLLEAQTRKSFAQKPPPDKTSEDLAWKLAAMNAAVEQLMTDSTINARTREIFRHVALLHESPKSVAEAFGVTRNNVDQIKNRFVKRLSELVEAMTKAR